MYSSGEWIEVFEPGYVRVSADGNPEKYMGEDLWVGAEQVLFEGNNARIWDVHTGEYVDMAVPSDLNWSDPQKVDTKLR